MGALKIAIRTVGGPAKAAVICGVSVRAVHKWMSRDALPRTEYTGETTYSFALAAASDGAFTAEWLKDQCRPEAA